MTHIVFNEIGSITARVAYVLVRAKFRVSYISTCGRYSPQQRQEVCEELALHNILPLDIENLDNIPTISQHFADFDESGELYIQQQMRDKYSYRTRNKWSLSDIDHNFFLLNLRRIVLHNRITFGAKIASVSVINPNERIYFIHRNILGLFYPPISNTRRIWVMDFGVFSRAISARVYFCKSTHFFRGASCISLAKTISVNFLSKIFGRRGSPGGVLGSDKSENISSRTNLQTIACIWHAGTSYGKMFEKVLFHQSCSHLLGASECLNAGYQEPFETSDGKPIHRIDFSFTIRELLSNWRALICARSARDVRIWFLCALLLSQTFTAKKSLADYTNLRLAWIDYDILCPLPIILALQELGVTTLAVQERIALTFYSTWGMYSDVYLTGSETDLFSAALLNNFKIQPKSAIPVGQYRSDWLDCSATSLNKDGGSRSVNDEYGDKFIVAFGYHSPTTWFESRIEPCINWRSQIVFLRDLMKLAEKFPQTHFVLRYKMIDWFYVSYFDEIRIQIESIINLSVDENYTSDRRSYDLIKGSYGVIAKPTSIGDEALARQIPVLWHDYGVNYSGMHASFYPVSHQSLFALGGEDFLLKASELVDDPARFWSVRCRGVCDELYGSLNDGTVADRIKGVVTNIYESTGFVTTK